MSQIDMYKGSETVVNPLKFYYGKNNTAYYSFSNAETRLLQGYNFEKPTQIRSTRGKFDYGSQDDGVIVTPNKLPYYNEKRDPGLFQHSRNRYHNEYEGTEKIFLYTGLNDAYGTASLMPNLYTEEGFIDIFCANIDGKDEDEVIKINNTRIDNINEKVVFKVYQGNLYSGLRLKHTRTYRFPTVVRDNDDGRSVHPKYYYSGDFNGDGKMEILAVSSDKPSGKNIQSKCYLFNVESGTLLFDSHVFPYVVDFLGSKQTAPEAAADNTDRLFIIDYDGDGKSDICHINDAGTHIYTFDVNGSSYRMRKIATYSGLNKNSLRGRKLMLGEFNGDGKPDLLVSPRVGEYDYNWAIHYSKGNGRFDKQPFSGLRIYTEDQIYTQDINSDGMSDLMVFSAPGFYSYIMKPEGAFRPIGYTYHTNNSGKSVIVPTDINSNNYFARMVCVKGLTATKYAFSVNNTEENLLTSIVNSLGVTEKNDYVRLNESQKYYTKGYGATYPYINAHGPMHVPVKREQYYNGQQHEHLSLSYENAIIHKQGLGFKGFSKITTIDLKRGGRATVQTYDPFRFGIMVSDDNPVSKTTNTYAVNVQSNKIAKINLTNRTVYDKTKGITQTAIYAYDNYGSPLRETIDFGDNIRQTTSNTYYNNTGTPYILGALTDRTVYVSRSGSSYNKRMYISRHDRGLPLTTIHYANGNKTSEMSYTYDSRGSVTRESMKPYNSSNELVTTMQYDSYGRLIRETNPLGLYTINEYDATTGLLAKKRNYKSQYTTYTYDDMFRPVNILYPDGVRNIISYAWSSAPGLYKKTSQVTGKPLSTVYYDALGREVRADATRFDGRVIHVDKQYDAYGRIHKESLPFTGNNPSLWNTYSYDFYDRPTAVSYASGKRTTYSYSGKNVTTTDNGISSIQKYDAQGNLISVSDPAGTITYQLRADGRPSSIVAPGNVRTTFSYDSYGRQTAINDPSAGNRTFGYDAAGNLVREVDADGRLKSMSYDRYGRLVFKVLPEFRTTYNYNQDGLLSSEISTNGVSRYFNYDTYNRLYSEKENVPHGKFFEKKYSYSAGNVASVIFSSQNGTIGEETYSYSNGYMNEIKLGSISVWKLDAENHLGMPVSVTTGPVTRTYSYNAYGLATGRSSSSRNSGVFQNHTYSFDPAKGNLLLRKDNRRNKQEHFTYDGLNRLKSYPGASMEYDVKGNITKKSDVGSRFYYQTPGKPYAVSGVDAGLNTSIPARRQAVTYSSFERPLSISENGYEAVFTYNASGSRKKMQLKKDSREELSRYYLGGRYELDEKGSSRKEKLYIGGDAYRAPAVYVKEGSGSWQMYYICRDYLGSITHLVNSAGSVSSEYSYDAWGRMRNVSSHEVYLPGSEPELFLGRGYTGHEHLSMFGLINMNARLYDPALGRFLSPDPYVQAPDFSQNFNRYSYALNNPLVYTDPNGEFFWIAVGIGAAIGGTLGYFTGKAAGLAGSDLLFYTFASAAIGGLSGGAGAAVGGAVAGFLTVGGFAGGAIAGSAGGAVGGFISGTFSTGLNNTVFGSNDNVLIGGLKSTGIGALAGGVLGGSIRGIVDYYNGYSFWDGSTVDEVLVEGVASQRIGSNYNSSPQADINDEVLKLRIESDFRVKEGDFNIKTITTKTSQGYGMNSSGKYINIKSGNVVGGYLRRFSTGYSHLHVSPHYSMAGDVAFRSVIGHELIHAYHHLTIPNFNRVFSERVAYKHTYGTYMGAGQYSKAMRVLHTALSRGYWGSYPAQYRIPNPLGW